MVHYSDVYYLDSHSSQEKAIKLPETKSSQEKTINLPETKSSWARRVSRVVGQLGRPELPPDVAWIGQVDWDGVTWSFWIPEKQKQNWFIDKSHIFFIFYWNTLHMCARLFMRTVLDDVIMNELTTQLWGQILEDGEEAESWPVNVSGGKPIQGPIL